MLSGSCTASDTYWSSTTFANDAENGWMVDFLAGADLFGGKIIPRHVRAVRGSANPVAGDLFPGQVCEKKIAVGSGHFCGQAPERAKYTLTNVGIHSIVVGPSSDCSKTNANLIPVNQARTYVLEQGQQLFIDRADEVLSSRTLTLQITTVEPCTDCTPDPTMGGC